MYPLLQIGFDKNMVGNVGVNVAAVYRIQEFVPVVPT